MSLSYTGIEKDRRQEMDIHSLEPYTPLIVGGALVILFAYGVFLKPRPSHSKYGGNKKDYGDSQKDICETKMGTNSEPSTDDKTQPSK